ncbi:hypothetical protein R5W23_002158 [Gemmata sp. JC673]|uniref:SMI1/KNR4 family protein n=1 Tax=Gemmata algarum TaxID=2975278 RepID=A0ABU5F4X6_9BACT|nr:hypothetical protein [Gemmata algarum]MDY3560909.1 hypothetical protein [Gemmata algarum]
MTEAEWQVWDSPYMMLDHLARLPPEDVEDDDPTVWPPARQARLFAVACCRHVERLLIDARSRAALDAVERYVDGRLTKKRLEQAARDAGQVTWELDGPPDGRYQATSAACSAAADISDHFTDAEEVARETASAAGAAARFSDESENAHQRAEEAEDAYQADLIRDIFGNPFRPMVLNPAWRTSDALALARGIYDEGAFDRLPILADALQDAGCDSDDILNHCRGPGPHVRGCWVVDLVLGK